MYPPTPSADSDPTFCAFEAVPRIVLTSPPVSTSSISIACQSWMCAPGSVAPSMPTLPNTNRRNTHASVAPTS